MNPGSVSVYAAQIAAGNGDAADRRPVDGVGAMHYADVVFAAPPAEASPTAGLALAKQPSKLRQSVSEAKPNMETELRASVFDALSLYTTLQEDAEFRARIQAERCQAANEEGLMKLTTFDKNFVYRNRVGFGVPRLVEETKIVTDLAFQERFGMPLTVPDEAKYTSVLHELQQQLVPRGVEADAMRTRVKRNVTQPLFPLGDEGTPNLLLAVNTFALTDVLAQVVKNLESGTEEGDRLKQAETALRAQVQEARNREWYKEVEALEVELQTVLLQRFQHHVDRVNLLGSGGGEKTQGLGAQLEAVLTAPGLPKLTTQKERLQAQIRNDIRVLEADRAQRFKTDAAMTQAYADLQHLTRDRLRKNFYDQDQEWKKVQEAMARIGDLGRGAHKIVTDHVHATEAEQKRRKEFAEFKESFATHRNYLEELADNTAAALDFIDKVRVFLDDGKKKVADMNVESRLADLAKTEGAALDKAYEACGSHVARRLHGLEVRVAGTSRMRVEMVHQRNVAVQSGDDGKAAYQKQADALELQHSAQQAAFDDLEAVFIDAQGQYVDAREACDVDGDGVPDNGPALRVLQLRAQLREKYAGQLGEVVELEARDVSSRKEAADAQSLQLQERHDASVERRRGRVPSGKRRSVASLSSSTRAPNATSTRPGSSASGH